MPDEICCNCGSAQDLNMVMTDMRATLYVFPIGGVEWRAKASLPYCPGCKVTAGMRTLGIAGMVVWWLIFWFAGFCATMGLLMFGKVDINAGHAQLLALGLAISFAVGMTLWFRRKPKGERTCNYQPVRYRGVNQHAFGRGQPGSIWHFSNPAYASLVQRAVQHYRDARTT